jgi:hypothetical protein
MLWSLAKCKDDPWLPTYLRCLANVSLNWQRIKEEFLNEVKGEPDNKMDWCAIIENTGYQFGNEKNRTALLELLLSILESHDSFSADIKKAAVKRMYEIVSDIGPAQFNEAPLSLPLSRLT